MRKPSNKKQKTRHQTAEDDDDVMMEEAGRFNGEDLYALATPL